MASTKSFSCPTPGTMRQVRRRPNPSRWSWAWPPRRTARQCSTPGDDVQEGALPPAMSATGICCARGGRRALRCDLHDEQPVRQTRLRLSTCKGRDESSPKLGMPGCGSSQNHFMLGQIIEWFYHDLAGIQCPADRASRKSSSSPPSLATCMGESQLCFRPRQHRQRVEAQGRPPGDARHHPGKYHGDGFRSRYRCRVGDRKRQAGGSCAGNPFFAHGKRGRSV